MSEATQADTIYQKWWRQPNAAAAKAFDSKRLWFTAVALAVAALVASAWGVTAMSGPAYIVALVLAVAFSGALIAVAVKLYKKLFPHRTGKRHRSPYSALPAGTPHTTDAITAALLVNSIEERTGQDDSRRAVAMEVLAQARSAHPESTASAVESLQRHLQRVS